MEDEKKLVVTITVDENGYSYETNMSKPETIFWLSRFQHKIQTELDDSDSRI